MDATRQMPQTQSARDFDALRRRRAELRESIGVLEEALAAPATGRAIAWGERVHAALRHIADDFTEHVVVTEGPDGLHADIQNAAPRLARAVTRLAGEHLDLTAEIAGLVAATQAGVVEVEVVAIRDRGVALLAALTRHRQRGADLVFEAFETDLGAGD